VMAEELVRILDMTHRSLMGWKLCRTGIPEFHRLDGRGIMPWAARPIRNNSPTERQRLRGLTTAARAARGL
jgi:hypothetical protein